MDGSLRGLRGGLGHLEEFGGRLFCFGRWLEWGWIASWCGLVRTYDLSFTRSGSQPSSTVGGLGSAGWAFAYAVGSGW
jgi:hypothetical protein